MFAGLLKNINVCKLTRLNNASINNKILYKFY